MTRTSKPAESANGSAYYLPEPSYEADLTRVERGTPMGELLRRYWHPVGLTGDATSRPKPVRVLGEDLILFRDGAGRAGLLYPRCCHRGTTLYYGKVENRGIRCCYHGWLFDVEGHCLDMPVEPDGGGNFRRKVRQPWYPVQERYGIVFAYLGPPGRQPLLPHFWVLEDLDEGETVEADGNGIGTGGGRVAPCNWLQHYENVMDPLHVPILHDGFSGTQFVGAMGVMPEVRFEPFALGVRSYQVRKLEDGRTLNRITETVLPTVRVVASPRLAPGRCESIGWTLPIELDDLHRLHGRASEGAGHLWPYPLHLWRPALGGTERARAPGHARRLGGAGGPRTDHLPLRGTSGLQRPRHHHAAQTAAGADGQGRGGRRPGRDRFRCG